MWMRLGLALCLAIAGCGGVSAVEGDQDGDGKADEFGGSCKVPGLAHQRVFSGVKFRQPVDMLQAPGDDSRWFIVEHTGAIKVIENRANVNRADIFLDLSDRTKVIYESGMNGLAFHPAFAQNGQVFVTYNAPSENHTSQWRLSRFTSNDGGRTVAKSSEEIFIAIDKDADEHNAGKIAFGPDGLLYIAIGDGGPSFDPKRFGQNTGVLFGKFLRINVDAPGESTLYSIPPSNPFANGNGRGEIYAWGLRNPWRWSFDRANGDIWAGEVGQDAYDSIHKIELGGNYGWADRESLHCFATTPCNGGGVRDAAAELPHPEWRSVIGGFVYHGNAIPALRNTYVFGDFVSGKVYGLFKKDGRLEPELIDKTGKTITAFAEDAAGKLYILDYAFGGIYKLIPGPCATADAEGPSYKFLMRAGISSDKDGAAYYQSIGAPTGSTLDQWIADNIGAQPTFSAFYRNMMDLGFWREMTCTQTIARGQGGCWVRNWQNADDKQNGKLDLGTVTMSLSPEGFTRFYVFGPGGTLQTFAILDGEGKKFVPQVCNTCHGGRYQGAGGAADLGSIWREFEPELLQPGPGVSREQAEVEWFNLNQAVKSANQAIHSEAEGAPVGTDHAKKAMIDYLNAMYPTGAAPAVGTRQVEHIPAAWRNSDDNPSLAETKRDLFTQLVNPYCMGCHRINALDFGSYDVFQTLAADQNGKAVLNHYIENDPTDPQRKRTVAMPQSELMFANLRADQPALIAVENWVVEASNPSVPSCKVTFSVSGADFTKPGENIFIVGDRPELGSWDTNQAIRLDGSAFPTWTGSVILPQGLPIQYKAVSIRSSDGRVLWESGNNHSLQVPERPTTRVENAWRR
jgi:glucose/arabinose dehydrogenase/mono/diheme cytochrome c family protein